MPQFGLRSIYAAKYNNNNGVISYSDIQHVGDAISANLELRYAEGRLYAEDMLAEYDLTAGDVTQIDLPLRVFDQGDLNADFLLEETISYRID